MANDFFNATAVPATSASLASATIRTEIANIAAGFDKMPALTGNGDKVILVNAGGTALTASSTLPSVTLSGTLTISAATRTISANFVETRAVGATAAGEHYIGDYATTLSGDAGGMSLPICYRFKVTSSGANAIDQIVSLRGHLTHNSGATVSTGYGLDGAVTVASTGNITNVNCVSGVILLESSGNVTTARLLYARTPQLTSTGSITTLVGFDAANLGHATLVGSAHSFRALNHTASVTLNTAFKGEMTSGTNKYNLYMSGTADNYLAGNLLVKGATAIPAGGTAGAGVMLSSTANFGMFFGSGAPTLSAAKGSIYLRSNGSSTTNRCYINTDGGTTWTALTTAA